MNYNNYNGSHNVAIGMHALLANTTGSQNTAVGYKALYASNPEDYMYRRWRKTHRSEDAGFESFMENTFPVLERLRTL